MLIDSMIDYKKYKWIRVKDFSDKTLHQIINDPSFVICGVPIFLIVSKKDKNFYE